MYRYLNIMVVRWNAMKEVEKNDDLGAKRCLEERGAVPRLASERGRPEDEGESVDGD